MKEKKSKDQIIEELRQRIAKLEKLEAEHKKVEEALKESEERYRSIVENSHAGILIVGEDYKFIYVNDELCRILKYSREKIIGHDFREFLDEESKQLVADRYIKRQRGEKVPSRYEFNVVQKNGEKRRVEISSTVIKDSAGKVRTVAQILDITERKKAEKEIKHLNLILLAIRKVNQLIAREKDRDRLLSGACDTLIKTRGYYTAWITIFDESGGLVTATEAGLGVKFLPMIEQLKRGELPDCTRKALNQSEIVVIKNPLSICIDCIMMKNCTDGIGTMAVRLEYGERIYGVLHVTVPVEFLIDKEEQSLFKEVTGDLALALYSIELEAERKKTEKELQESEEKYRQLIKISPDAVYVHSDRKIVFVNPAMMEFLGAANPEDLIGKPISDIIHPDYLRIVEERDRNIEQKGERVPLLEEKFIRLDGTIINGEAAAAPLIYQGKPAILVVIRDITEHKRLEQQREKARKEAEFYADVLGHDVGNINQIISGYLYLLENAKDEETRKKNIKGIKKSIEKSKRLAESIKILKTIKDTKIERFDLNKSIERSIKKIKAYFDREIEVKLNIDKKYYVKANDFLDKVFFNIFENSAEYTFHDPVIIDVKTEKKDDFCNIYIHDNGLGISKEKREDIIENLETLSKRTGIGFYLTNKILDRFNGKFEIKDVEKGTEIVISIPVIS